MRTVHLQTKRILSHDRKGQSVFETIVQKLRSNGINDDFEQTVSRLNAVGYADVTVMAVFELGNHKEVDEIEKYQKIINDVIEPEEEVANPIEAENKSLRADLDEIKATLAVLEMKGIDFTQVDKEETPEEYRKEVQEAIKALGGSIKGMNTIEQLENRLEELK